MNCAPPPPFLIPNSPAPHLSFSLPSSLPFNFLLLPEYGFSLSYYHLVLLQRKKIPASGETDRNLWREGKLLSRKSNVKKIRKSTPPLSITSSVFPVFTGNWIQEADECFQLTLGQLMFILYHLFPKVQGLYIKFIYFIFIKHSRLFRCIFRHLITRDNIKKDRPQAVSNGLSFTASWLPAG